MCVSIDIRDLGIFTNPDTVVNHAADVLGEVTVQVRRNGRKWFIYKDFDMRLGGPGGTRRQKPGAGG